MAEGANTSIQEFDDETLQAITEVYKEEGNSAYKEKEFHRAVDFYTQGLETKCKDDELNAKLYSNRATTHFYMGKYCETLADARAALQLRPNYIKAIERGASACMKLGMYEEAVTWCDKGLALFQNNKKLMDLKNEAIEAQRNVKESFKSRGANGDGVENHGPYLLEKPEALIQIAAETGNKPLQRILYAEIGHKYRKSGRINEAINLYELELKMAKELRQRKEQGFAYSHLGNAELDRGNLKQAIVYHEFHLNITKELGDRLQEGSACGNLGNAHHEIGDYKRAIYYHNLSLEIAKEVDNKTGQGNAYGSLGNDYFGLGDLKRAVHYHKLQLNVAQEVGDKVGETTVYANLGLDYLRLGDIEKAINNHEFFLKFSQETGDRNAEVRAYNFLGADYLSRNDLKKAIYYHSLCLDICKEVGNKAEEGRVCANLGSSYNNMGNYAQALKYHQLHLEIARQTGNISEQGKASGNLGDVYRCLGDSKKALAFHERSLEIARDVGDKITVGYLYVSLGRDYHSLSDLKRAVHYQTLALDIFKSEDCKTGLVAAYEALGNSYKDRGDIEDAVQCHEACLKISREIGDLTNEGSANGNLGNVYQVHGDLKKAKEHHELQVYFAKKVGDKTAEGIGYLNLGNDCQNLMNYREAIHYHEFSLKIAKEQDDIPGMGKAYGNLGKDYDALEDFEKAVEFHKLHLEVAEKLDDKLQVANALGNLGNAYRGLQDSHNAEHYYRRQLELAKKIKDIFGEIAANNNLGNFFETQGSHLEALAHLKSSVGLLNDVRARLHLRDEWKINLRHLHRSSYTRLWVVLIKLEKIDEALSAAEQGRTQALKDLMEYNYGLFTPSDNRGESSAPEVILLETLSIPSNAIFFAVTDKTVVSWLIRGGLVVDVKAEKTSDVDSTAFFCSLMKTLLTDIGVRSETGVRCEDRSLDEEKDERGEHELPSETHPAHENNQSDGLRSLYDFLIAPMAGSIDGDELVIVPEGHLWLVPFAALKDKNSKYLSESLRIRVSPSLTILKTIADCPTDYHNKDGALLVGDPWVQEIVIGKKKKLEQLPCAREEVEMIGKILNTKPLTDRQATKDEVLKRLSSVALVHIAAHGRMATGEIALCPNPDRTSERPKRADYLLKIADVLEVKLRAKLVVLSCCHSGRGQVKAEGVVGIARAFLGAGARSVLVSLWAIDDEATLEFMKEFYQKLTDGKSASEALSRAMKSMRQSDDFSEVKYWAPFVLIGDDVTLDFGGGHK
ncbi:tetratricopeptide repeat protein 28-like [Acropora millepora]|uniref:tetratricopeptide repeat protein 28-like n=1 Tax=Acropora millepora TaxID=45264 RepID=UPI001CF44BD2|nr:tetratricopeptide repeat protein 28-like [Acropora millepora]XP_029196288.2 tetratricopeptide repeat protein 28-like [Acropora millepora]